MVTTIMALASPNRNRLTRSNGASCSARLSSIELDGIQDAATIMYRCSHNDYRINMFLSPKSVSVLGLLMVIQNRICICNEGFSADISTDLSL